MDKDTFSAAFRRGDLHDLNAMIITDAGAQGEGGAALLLPSKSAGKGGQQCPYCFVY